MRDLPINALRVFAAIFESGGVRPAARSLGIAHSSVTRHLSELEKWMGIPLVERQRAIQSGLKLTPQGSALGRAASESIEKLAASVRSLRETSHSRAVVLATTASVASLWLLPRLGMFASAHPGIELSVIVEQKVMSPRDQAADLALRMGNGPWPGLECEALMDDRLFPMMSRSMWEDAGRPSDPALLRHLRLLHDRDPHGAWERWLAEHGPMDIDTTRGPRFASSDLLLRAAAQGLGVALGRGRLAADDLASGALVRPFGDREVRLPDAYWIVRPPGTDSAAIKAVIQWLRFQARILNVVLDG